MNATTKVPYAYDYGTADEIGDVCSRIASLVDDDVSNTHLADYSYLGLGSPVIVDYPKSDVPYTLADLTNSIDPDTGDSRARVVTDVEPEASSPFMTQTAHRPSNKSRSIIG